MDSTTILVVLALIGSVCSNPVSMESSDPCPDECELTTKYQQLDIQHILDLQNTSVAPWNITTTYDKYREPPSLQVAECRKCTVGGMVARPINILIKVIKVSHDSTVRCKCPFELAVGCTCVKDEAAKSH